MLAMYTIRQVIYYDEIKISLNNPKIDSKMEYANFNLVFKSNQLNTIETQTEHNRNTNYKIYTIREYLKSHRKKYLEDILLKTSGCFHP